MRNKSFLFFLAFLLFVLPSRAASWGISSNPRETIFLQTDRDIYVAGENLFFNLILFSEPVSQGNASGFAYLALRNEKGIIKRGTVQLDRQQASGNLYLPDTLSSGYYELIAFTNWMRNAGEEWYFRKTLFIANRFDTTLEALFPSSTTSPVIRFFPEGGSLVREVENRVLMLAEGPLDASSRKFSILTSTGDTLALHQLNEHGWASFSITPRDSIHYFAALEGEAGTFPLPAPAPYGAALQVNSQADSLKVVIPFREINPSGARLRLEQNGRRLKEYPLNGSGKEDLFLNIPSADLPEGIFLIRISGSQGEELARRFWFNHKHSSSLNFFIDDQFSKREKITLEMENTSEIPFSGLQVSLARKEAIQDKSLSLRGWQTSFELARALEMNPREACEIFGPLSPEEINQRLSAFGREGNFDFSLAPGRNVFFLETDRLIVSGRVTQSLDGKPLENVRVILNTPDTLVNLRYTRTNGEGEFQFLLDGYYNDRELVFTADPGTYSGLIDIEINDKFVFEQPFKPQWFTGLAAKRDYLLQAQEVVRVNKAFGLDNLEPAPDSSPSLFPAPRLFAHPVSLIRLDDYAPLDDLRDISRELILSWRIRRSGDQYRHSMINTNSRRLMEGSPVLFIDGIITFNLEPLIELNSSTLSEIHIQSLDWVHGEMHFPGIIALFTKNAIWKELGLLPRPRVVFHEAPRRPRRFMAPDYQGNPANVPLPDLRNLLFWDPALGFGSESHTRMEFFAGDLSGEFLLQVQGIGPDGKAILFQKVITVKP